MKPTVIRIERVASPQTNEELAALRQEVANFRLFIEAMRPPEPPRVNFEPGAIVVNSPAVNVAPAQVTVQPAQVNVTTPAVKVQPAQVTVEMKAQDDADLETTLNYSKDGKLLGQTTRKKKAS